MKKINVLLLGVLVAFAGFVSSCQKDENTPAPTIKASLNDQVKDALTVTAGSTVTYKFEVTAPGEIKSIQLSKKIGTSTTTDPAKTSGFLKDTFDIVSASLTVNEATDLTLTVIDKNSITVSKTVSIAVNASTISTYTGTLLYVPDAGMNAKVYFASSTGETFSYNGIGTNSAKVDFGYYYGTSAGHSFYALTANPITSYNLSNWTKNATILKKLSGVNFDAIASSSDIATACGTIGSANVVNNLAVNDVVGFNTAAGKYGVVKITAKSADSNAEGTNITFTAKVQK